MAGADESVPVVQGLVVHLDARSAEADDSGKVAIWKNELEGTSDFVSDEVAHRPSVVDAGDVAVVRFGGNGERLRSTANTLPPAEELTVFLLAAPHENVGDYRGFLAANAAEQRDYQSGFNIDLGRTASQNFNSLNVEGVGFEGEQNLLSKEFEFGTPHQITVQVSATNANCSLRVDGVSAGERAFIPSSISLEEFTVGARFYTNGREAQQVRGELKCDIAEILIYRRALTVEERDAVEAYLNAKLISLRKNLPATLLWRENTVRLAKAVNPPLIQMLVPGFEVEELPVQLTNINNVRYRSDGTLIALAYNGDIHLLSDTDGDGLEDQARLFWKNEGAIRGPIGLLVTPEDYSHGQGVFVPSKGKVSLIVDEDGDEEADREIVVASGWKEIPQNVDATGIAMDDEGYLYFGLGTANYANAYLIDEEGKAGYDLASDRGTVQRVSPDFSRRETVCTGIRFPISFAFNEYGDLFCSEQEGATWLANGNPFDELLHIQAGRHYGFPPRHPRHNPQVIDEPSVFDYSPQHQSTCGLVFNALDPKAYFGPRWWAGDAIVCGESRGKIWRTQLAKTAAGYVAQAQLIACLQMLTVDACVSPQGDLIVACHSGPPDWGTGPTGMGKLFRLRMKDREVARPVKAWASSMQEIVISFDREVDPEQFQGVLEHVRIHYGPYVRPGDAYENLVPPYAVVQRQLATPRSRLPLHGIALSADRRNLLVQTDRLQVNTNYAISLPLGSEGTRDPQVQGLGQHSLIEVGLSLNGVTAEFQTSAGDLLSTWKGWLPHLDWQVADQFTRPSARHDELRQKMTQGGTLHLSTKLDLRDILRPKVQPGSELDYDWPEERVQLVFESLQQVRGRAGEQDFALAPNGPSRLQISVPAQDVAEFLIEFEIEVPPNQQPDFAISVKTEEDSRPRALPLSRFVLPWVSNKSGSGLESIATRAESLAEVEGGSWGAGRRVFHSEAAACFKCHSMGLAGPNIGPDLSNLVHRDYQSVLRDIENPSFAINPDYLGQRVLLKSDEVLTGVLQTRQEQMWIGSAEGKQIRIRPEEIQRIQPAKVSIMPTGLLEKLSPQQRLDLMTFLLTAPPQMPLDSPLEAPPVRTGAEVAAVLAGSQVLPEELPELKIVLVAGKKDHGPGEHDYPAWQIQWKQLLSASKNVEVDSAWGFPSREQMDEADVLMFFQKGAWTSERQRQMDAFFQRGGGAVYIHWAVNGDDRAGDFARRIGLASRGGSIGYRHGPLSLEVHNTDHPIMRNIEPLQLYDESYWRLTGDVEDVTLFATSIEDGLATPQMWAYEKGQGRVFVSIPGHYSWTFDDPIFRTLLLRGLLWTAKQPVDRLNELVRPGARMSK